MRRPQLRLSSSLASVDSGARSPRPRGAVCCLPALPSWRYGVGTWSGPGAWWLRPCRWSRPTRAMPRRSMPSACAWRPTAPSWPGHATLAGRSPTTAPPPRCWTGSTRPLGTPPAFPQLAAWRATALAELTRRNGQSDPATWATATAAWQRLGQPYRVAYACFRQAEALIASKGDRDTAAVALRHAADITGRLGARPLDTEVKALAQRARLNVTPDAAATPGRAPTPIERLGLTPREAEVLALTLFISPKTASVHVSNILAKLGVSGRVEAAALAHRLGLDKG